MLKTGAGAVFSYTTKMDRSIAAQESYYTNRWNQFENANAYQLQRMALALRFMTMIELPSRPNICDLGCGAGWSSGVLGVFGEATGVDLADLSGAQQRFPYCHFVSANVLEWDFPKGAFDLVVSLEVLEHIEASAQAKYVSIAYQALKPGGHLILTTPNMRTLNAVPGGELILKDQPIENWLHARELDQLLQRNGFIVVKKRSLIFGEGQRGLYRFTNSHKLNSCMEALGLGPLWGWFKSYANFGLHLAVLARKPLSGSAGDK